MVVLFIILTVSVLAVDLITKFTFSGTLNPGISWGIGSGLPWLATVVIIFSFVAVIALCIYFFMCKNKDWILTVGSALFIAGTLGNAIDRLVSNGMVHDFIDFIIFQNNIADMAIIGGAILLGVKFAFR